MDLSVYLKILTPIIIIITGIVLYKWNAWNQVFRESMTARSKLTRERGLALADYCSDLALQLKSELEMEAYDRPIDEKTLNTIKDLCKAVWIKSYFCTAEVKISSQTLYEMVRLIEYSHNNEGALYKDVDVKVMVFFFLMKIMEFSLSTVTPRRPKYIGVKKHFKSKVAKYAYGEYLNMNDTDFSDISGKSTNHVLVTLYHSCVKNIGDTNFLMKKLFVESIVGKNEFLLIDMIMLEIAFPYKIDLNPKDSIFAVHIENNENLGLRKEIDHEDVALFYSPNSSSEEDIRTIETALKRGLSHMHPKKISIIEKRKKIFRVDIAATELRKNFKRKKSLIRYLIFKDHDKNILHYLTHEIFLAIKTPIFLLPNYFRGKVIEFLERKKL